MSETDTAQMTANMSSSGGICVFSGGTAANSLVDVFEAVSTHLGRSSTDDKAVPCPLAYIIPISDNGGSSSELIRFFGGPSVGDVRSRLVRLIPKSHDSHGQSWDGAFQNAAQAGEATNGRTALRALMEHRLCTSDPREARAEWLDLVEARHVLWTFVPDATRELIRAVFNTLNLEIVKRMRPTSVFNFAGASVGNLFLTGARLFSGSFEAAIYLLSLLCGIPDHVVVLPSISSNFTHHISAGLVGGTTIAGQVNISHPSAPTSLPDGGTSVTGLVGGLPGLVDGSFGPDGLAVTRRGRAATAVDFEDATLPGSLPVLRRPQIAFSKEDEEDLPSRIARIWYINPYGHEIRPPANPKALAALGRARAIVYSIGSLYTSIIPSLILRGVGSAIADGDSSRSRRPKILILNSKLDRETGPRHDAMTAVDFVKAIARACQQSQQSQQDGSAVQDDDCQKYVTHVVYLTDASRLSRRRLDQEKEGVEEQGGGGGGGGGGVGDDDDGRTEDRSGGIPDGPAVDEGELNRLGVSCVPVPNQGRQSGSSGVERYDEEVLTRVLQGIMDGGAP